MFLGWGEESIMEELLADRTKVTAILFSSVGIEHKNFTEILLPTDVDAGMTQLSKVVMDKPGLLDPRLWKFLYNAATWDVTDVALDVVRPIQVQQLIEERPKVDAVVTMWSTGTIFAEVFDCPIILFSPNTPFMTHGTTNVINYSVQPLVTSPFIEPMTLMQRLMCLGSRKSPKSGNLVQKLHAILKKLALAQMKV